MDVKTAQTLPLADNAVLVLPYSKRKAHTIVLAQNVAHFVKLAM